MRTQAEILRDCERRYAQIESELEKRANTPWRTHPCSTCKWAYREYWCRQPLVWGVRDDSWGIHFRSDEAAPCLIPLCGREKALWEPRTRWQNFKKWSDQFWWVYLCTVLAAILSLPFILFSI